MSRLGRHLIQTYLSCDPRSLGLFRILLGLALLFDLWLRFLGARYWYTEEGLLPTSLMRDLPNEYAFSLFFHLSTYTEALLGLTLCAVIYVCFIFGFKTRLFHILAWLALISLNNRVFVLANGGHSVLILLCTWSMFLPLGRRFSVDARRAGAEPDNRGVVSLAVLALYLQVAVIYLFNFLHKDGLPWRDGSAVHYVLWDERMVTAFAVWLRGHLPYGVVEGLARGTPLLEALAVVLILSPVWSHRTRLAAILVLPALHLGFALCLRLGVFSYAMIAFYPLLLAPRHWVWCGGARERLHAAAAPARASSRTALVVLREGLVLLVMVASVGNLALLNPAWPTSLRYRQPEFLNAIVRIPRLRQHWIQFSPQPPRIAVALAVVAETQAGRIVDPYNEAASRYPALPRSGDRFEIPPRLGQSQFFASYTERMPGRPFDWLRPALTAWILRYHERSGEPADRIVRFDVFKVTGRMPSPGGTALHGPGSALLYSYP